MRGSSEIIKEVLDAVLEEGSHRDCAASILYSIETMDVEDMRQINVGWLVDMAQVHATLATVKQ